MDVLTYKFKRPCLTSVAFQYIIPFIGPEGGWENHIPSDDPKEEVISLLSALRLVRECQTLVHSKSNLADYIYSEMKAAHTKVKKVNLDQGKGDRVHHVDNPKSVSISHAYDK